MRFAAIGDTGKGNDTQKQVGEALGRVCENRGCDFVLLLGDNLYPRGMVSDTDPRMKEVFDDVYGHTGLDFHVVLGNHDYGNAGDAGPALHQLSWAKRQAHYGLPARFYRFEVADVGFWALDTDAVFWHGPGAQGDWLDETLESSEAKTKIVFGHHPYRSNGKHGNAGAYEGWSVLPYASGAPLRTLFEDHVVGKADLYLSGHDHNLQSFDHEGLELIVSGAGAGGRPLVDRGNTLELGFDVPGFAWVEIGPQSDAGGPTTRVMFFDQTGSLLGERKIYGAL